MSRFPFKERVELVKQGTANLENVLEIPSCKFIISATFRNSTTEL